MNSKSEKAARVRKVLRKAIKLIEKGWTKGTYARDQHGTPVSYKEPAACQFCSAGAMYRALADVGELENGTIAMEARQTLRETAKVSSIVIFNDSHDRSKAEVVETFKQAIKRVR